MHVTIVALYLVLGIMMYVASFNTYKQDSQKKDWGNMRRISLNFQSSLIIALTK